MLDDEEQDRCDWLSLAITLVYVIWAVITGVVLVTGVVWLL